MHTVSPRANVYCKNIALFSGIRNLCSRVSWALHLCWKVLGLYLCSQKELWMLGVVRSWAPREAPLLGMSATAGRTFHLLGREGPRRREGGSSTALTWFQILRFKGSFPWSAGQPPPREKHQTHRQRFSLSSWVLLFLGPEIFSPRKCLHTSFLLSQPEGLIAEVTEKDEQQKASGFQSNRKNRPQSPWQREKLFAAAFSDREQTLTVFL